jgi:hypothetical protein
MAPCGRANYRVRAMGTGKRPGKSGQENRKGDGRKVFFADQGRRPEFMFCANGTLGISFAKRKFKYLCSSLL